MNFQFFSPTILINGAGRVSSIGELAASYGNNALVVAGSTSLKNNVLATVLEPLVKAGLVANHHIKPSGEPTIDDVNDIVLSLHRHQCNMIISLGGGSIIDAAKAAAGVATNGGDLKDYLEGVGSGKTVARPALPHIAIPTTAGTGAEVTRNAVISSKEGQFKKSIRSPYLCPLAAILDAELTLTLPKDQTAYSGLDAITQLIEAYISCKANPMTDALALFGLELALPSIREVYNNPNNVEARQNLLLASTISGICLANAGLGLAHGFASGLGAICDVPHGKVCAMLLPHALRINRTAALPKIARIGKYFAGDRHSNEEQLAELAIASITQLTMDLGIPLDLKELQITDEQIPQIVKKSMGNSMSGNPFKIEEDYAATILQELV